MVVATGGMAEQIAENSETIDHIDKLLTLEGLRIIYERNKISVIAQKLSHLHNFLLFYCPLVYHLTRPLLHIPYQIF